MADEDGQPRFQVLLRRSDRLVVVEPGQSILEALWAAGLDVPSSCREGHCGTCEQKVLAGRPLHRDDVLTDGEKATGKTLMICVSRSLDPVLELDL